MWKKTFKTIHQLSCFVGHPVTVMYTCVGRVNMTGCKRKQEVEHEIEVMHQYGMVLN